MAATERRIFRLNQETQRQLAEIFRQVVPLERRPAHARSDTDWQIVEGLRMIAAGELELRMVRLGKRRL